jgi:hypothetical protein
MNLKHGKDATFHIILYLFTITNYHIMAHMKPHNRNMYHSAADCLLYEESSLLYFRLELEPKIKCLKGGWRKITSFFVTRD